METHVSPTLAIETIENGENANITTNTSTPISSVVLLDGPTIIKREKDRTPNHVVVSESLEMPPEDPGDIEGIDEEDILEIYTAQPSNLEDNASLQAPASTKFDRPDFSSTSEDEAEEINFTEPKLLLQSDISRPSSYKFPSKSRMFERSVDDEDEDEDEDQDIRYADQRIYMRCMPCIRSHRTCNRGLPHCQRCTSPSECFYPRKADFKGNQGALDAFPNPKKEFSQKRSPSESKASAAKRSFDPKSAPASQSIIWQEGDTSHSQKKCPAIVLSLIREHRRDFEGTQLAGIWPKDKTVYSERGRDCVFVDEQTDVDIPVARYIYKGTKQFFVAWLPARDTSQPSIPVVCKFRVYKMEPDLHRNGGKWMPLRWLTWCPNNEAYHRRDIIRLVATSAYKASTTMRSPEILDLDTNSRNGQYHQRSSRIDDSDLTEDDTDDDEEERPAKKLKRGSTERSRKNHRKLIRPQGPNGKFLPRNSVSSNPHDSASLKTSIGPRQPVKYLVREPQLKEPPLTVIFKDSSGSIQGSYPYHECNTAEKLFDVACVTRIAQIEPPATRLLKVEFEGGGDGCVRPDSASDYEKVFKTELKRLMDAAPSSIELKVVIRPYR